MSDFSTLTTIKATRRAHLCEQCGKMIAVAAPAKYLNGRYEGEFYSNHFHVECFEAAEEYADLHGLSGEEYPWFQHYDYEQVDRDWMREKHPVVADRLGWSADEDEP